MDTIQRVVNWIFGIAVAIMLAVVVVGFFGDLRDGELFAEVTPTVPQPQPAQVVVVATATPAATPVDVPTAIVNPPTVTPYIPPTSTGAPLVFLQEGPAPTWTPAPAAPVAPAVNNGIGDGQFVVGTDIQPGTYRAPGGSLCYWERLSGFSGTSDDRITNDIPVGPAIVTISPSDAGFYSQGCGGWVKQ